MDAYLASIRAAESGGNDAARNPRSSAAGRYQFIESTWNGLAQKYPGLALTDRFDPQQQERAIRAFTRDNAQVLKSAGIDPNPGNLYAAHFLGAGGARTVLSQADDVSVASILPQEVIRANPFLSGMTVGQFRDWSASKGGGGGAAPRETLSTSGLLNEAPQMDEPQQGPLGGLLGIKRDTSKINDLGLALMALSSPRAAPAFMQMAQGRREEAAGRRKEREEAGRANRTVEWLAQQPGGQQFAALAEALGPQAAVQAYMQAQKGQDPTALQQNYEYALAQGMTPEEARAWVSSGTKVEVNTGAGGQNIGTIPQGYAAVPDPSHPSGFRMEAIPGGPEDKSQAQAAAAGNAATATDVITTAAQRARDAAAGRALGGVGQGIVAAVNPYSDSAEVARQVEVLKSNAKVENLQAMRVASPTGGALGAVSDSESAMLAAKAGALDPSSPTFTRDLDDYERTLLRIVHGQALGDQIFEQTRTQPAATGGGDDDLFKKYGIAP